jgi:hypothetical protein
MTQSSRVWIAVLFIAVLAFIAYQLLGVGLLVGLGGRRPDCSDALKETVVSPDGKYKAVLMQRNCGFAAETYAHVDTLLSSETASIDRASGKIQANTVVASTESYEDFTIEWLSPRTLLIRCKSCTGAVNEAAGVLARRTSWNDVAVSYVLH